MPTAQKKAPLRVTKKAVAKKAAAEKKNNGKGAEAASVEASMRIEMMALSTLQRWPRNPKLHDHFALSKSLKRWGYTQAILIDEKSGKMVAGHGRIENLVAAKEQGKEPPKRIVAGPDGEWYVPVQRGVSFENESEAEAYLLADNRIVELGGWDTEGLLAMLDDVSEPIGWDPADIDKMRAALAKTNDVGEAPEDFEEFDEGAKKTHTCPQCGFHVVCFDTTPGK